MNGKDTVFSAARATLQGDRPLNQDRCFFYNNGDTILLGLGDGLGGHPRGEIAAQLLADVCETLFRQVKQPLTDPEHFMLQCIGKAHQAILRFGRRQNPRIAPRTTAVLAIVQDGTLYWAHVGDSRLYLLREGRVYKQTRDHAHIQFIRQSAGQMPRARSSLTRCIGGMLQPPTTTCGSATVLGPDDTVLLCSDGLWGQVEPQHLVEQLTDTGRPLDECLPDVVEQAARVNHSDNVTALALRWHAGAGDPSDISGLREDDEQQLDRAIRHLQGLIDETKNSNP